METRPAFLRSAALEKPEFTRLQEAVPLSAIMDDVAPDWQEELRFTNSQLLAIACIEEQTI
ncbi:hypothetical protein [Labrenzia sp. DG1229]|uniref:hypothetical protein n=1 Tax=Labrenzia sp. DG1229 TaxID=681847 RepID=UPI0004903229|nr:hypothetical protein [Labrenzia sp. DG1229]